MRRRLIYMRFLYRWSPIPLENMRDKWHFIGASVSQRYPSQGVPMLDFIIIALGLGLFVLSARSVILCPTHPSGPRNSKGRQSSKRAQ